MFILKTLGFEPMALRFEHTLFIYSWQKNDLWFSIAYLVSKFCVSLDLSPMGLSKSVWDS